MLSGPEHSWCCSCGEQKLLDQRSGLTEVDDKPVFKVSVSTRPYKIRNKKMFLVHSLLGQYQMSQNLQ